MTTGIRVPFEHADLDQDGALELAEAKALFDSYHIHFENSAELNSYFIQNKLPFEIWCNLLADKGMTSRAEANEARNTYAISLGLTPQDLNDPERFYGMSQGILWLERVGKPTHVSGSYDTPPGPNVELAKEGIIKYVVATTGRKDDVTYENAHLTKEEADLAAIKAAGTFYCHPAEGESCTTGRPCCQDMVCCSRTVGDTEGYCAKQC